MFLRLPTQGGSPRQVAEVVNRILDGKVNSVAEVTVNTTLAPVTVTDPRVGAGSAILLCPMNTDATTLLSHIYFSTITNGSFTISLRSGHGSAIADFRYVVLG